MDSFDPIQLDVGGGRRPGDERDRPTIAVYELGQSRHRLGHELDDLGLVDDADMKVGNEASRHALPLPAPQ